MSTPGDIHDYFFPILFAITGFVQVKENLQGKSQNFSNSFSRLGKFRNFDLGHGKSWKMKITLLKHGSLYF